MKMKRVQSTCNYCALDCNMDFYVEDGRIVQCGKHEELLRQGGLYKRFTDIRRQAEGWNL